VATFAGELIFAVEPRAQTTQKAPQAEERGSKKPELPRSDFSARLLSLL
jgi:hypothetical protein